MRILWVSNHSPFQVDFGGGQRSNLIYRVLREIADIDVMILAPDGAPDGSPEEVYGHGEGHLEVVRPTRRGERVPWSIARPLAPRTVDRAAYNLGRSIIDYSPNPAVMKVMTDLMSRAQYDLFVGRHLKNSGQAGLLRWARTIVDVDDNEIDLYRWIIRDPSTDPIRKLVLRARVRRLETLIPKVVADGPRLWVTKEDDRSSPGFAQARVLSNIPFAMAEPDQVPSPHRVSSTKTILFVGMLSYIYNVQGIDWFLSAVWPGVRAAVPEARFCIVGSRLRDRERARWSAVDGVDVIGFVADLSVAYRDCRFVVAPVWSGGGTNIKTLEALMNGRPCVLTSAAYKGFGRTFPQGEAVLVAGDATEMVAHCTRLLGDEGLCSTMGRRGAGVVAQHYSFSEFRRVVLDTVEEVQARAANWEQI